MRRGHPWLVDRSLWRVLLAIEAPQTMRDFLDLYTQQIEYTLVDSDTILRDIDTPADYDRERPANDGPVP
jgi:CTP:molybdopterin cytidylyltransferase MocA